MFFTAPYLSHLVADADLDGAAEAVVLYYNGQLAPFEGDLDWRPAELHGEHQPIQVPYRLRVEAENAVADLGPQVASLDQIERPGHHSHVDAFLGGAALHVTHIALQRHHVPAPRTFRVQVGQDARVHDEAQSGTVGGPAVVVGNFLTGRVGRVGVAEPLEDPLEFFLREKEEQQHNIGLL